MYEYRARVTKVFDGDTITCDIDLGFGVLLRKQTLRLFGINAQEINSGTEEQKALGKMARIALTSEILGDEVLIVTHKDSREKYGRWLAQVFTLAGVNVNKWMVENGYAVPYMEEPK